MVNWKAYARNCSWFNASENLKFPCTRDVKPPAISVSKTEFEFEFEFGISRVQLHSTTATLTSSVILVPCDTSLIGSCYQQIGRAYCRLFQPEIIQSFKILLHFFPQLDTLCSMVGVNRPILLRKVMTRPSDYKV